MKSKSNETNLILQCFRDNAYGQWAGNGKAEYASNRLKEDIFLPRFKPPFLLESSDSIFAVGSCFARALEQAFKRRDHAVLSDTEEFDKWIPDQEIRTIHVTNKYNPASILHDLQLSFDQIVPEKNDNYFIEAKEGLYVDPLAHPIFTPSPIEVVIERRRITNKLNSLIAKADIVVVTLGLIETWEDSASGITLNFTPSKIHQDHPDRFKFKVMTFSETMMALNGIYELLTKHNPSAKKIFTVSPIPLYSTFTGNDIVIANTHSKSCLRTAVGEFCSINKDILYFPSYEMVMNNKSAWRDDLRHVNGEFAHKIIDYLMDEAMN